LGQKAEITPLLKIPAFIEVVVKVQEKAVFPSADRRELNRLKKTASSNG
jgi:hypothetical protein